MRLLDNNELTKCLKCGGELIPNEISSEIFVCENCETEFIIKGDAGLNSKPEDFIFSNGVLFRYIGNAPIARIPNGVTVINDKSFENQRGIRAVVIPPSVKEIGKQAFANCKNLRYAFCLSNSIETIDDEAFYNCENLNEFTVSWACKIIGKRAFANCKSLISIKVSEYGIWKLELIDEEAFSECISLKEFELIKVTDNPEGGTSFRLPRAIKAKAFYNCKNLLLDKRTFSCNSPTIEEYSFYGCDNLSELNFDFYTFIDKYAFANCKGLKCIRLGNEIRIKEGAFKDCTNLENVFYTDRVCKGGFSKVLSEQNSFEGTPILETHKYLFENKLCLTCGAETKKSLLGVLFDGSRQCVKCGAIQYYESDCILSSDREYIQPYRIKRGLCKYCGEKLEFEKFICKRCGKDNTENE